MRSLQAVTRLGSQTFALGCRRYHPNSPGDLIPKSKKYESVQKVQKVLTDEILGHEVTHRAGKTKDKLLFYITIGVLLVLCPRRLKDAVTATYPKDNS